jgi:hypothetical protein
MGDDIKVLRMEHQRVTPEAGLTVFTDFNAGGGANPPSTVVVVAAYRLGLIESGAEIGRILAELRGLSETSPAAEGVYRDMVEALTNLDNADELHQQMLKGEVSQDMETYYEVTLNSVVTGAVRAIRDAVETIELSRQQGSEQ